MEGEGPGRKRVRDLIQGSELRVDRIGDVGRLELGALADVEEGGAGGLLRANQGQLHLREAGLAPGGHAAGQLAGEMLVPHLQALPDQVLPVLTLRQHEHEGPIPGHQPPQPGGEGGTELDGQGPGDVPGRELPDGPGVDHLGAPLQEPSEVFGPERAEQGRPPPVHRGAPPVHLPESQEVPRVGPAGRHQVAGEGLLVGSVEQRAPRLLLPDRGGGPTPRHGAGRAERGPRIVRRVDRSVVGQDEQPVLDRPEQCPGERLGLLRGEEVGPGHRASQQGSAGERGEGRRAVEQQIRQVLGGVAGGRQGL